MDLIRSFREKSKILKIRQLTFRAEHGVILCDLKYLGIFAQKFILWDYRVKLKFWSKLRSANIFQFFQIAPEKARIFSIVLYYKKRVLGNLEDLATSRLQIFIRDAAVGCVQQCCGSGSGRIRTFLVGSGRLGPYPDPDPDPGLNKWPYINFFGVCKSHKYLRITCCLTFWFMNILFKAFFGLKKFLKKFARKFI
jgi:hypothetical protein